LGQFAPRQPDYSPAPITPQKPVSANDFADFFENGGIPLHLAGDDGCILHANAAELELLGYAAEEYIGRPIAGYLPNDTCMPLALILNERLTNSAKHGVNGSDAGEITVALRRVGAHMILSVEDNGPGFELGDTRRRSSGLGLVRGLTQQLRGSFKVERASGARCTVTFPENRTS
jgi:PAS domain S-box-containing protein